MMIENDDLDPYLFRVCRALYIGVIVGLVLFAWVVAAVGGG